MAGKTGSVGHRPGPRAKDSIPVLLFHLGRARDFLVALGILALVMLVAMVVAFAAFG
jgi:hypothetical protein